MTRAERRSRRERIIARRVRQFVDIYDQGSRRPYQGRLWRPMGSLAKRKLIECSCWMCANNLQRPMPYRGKERQVVRQGLREEELQGATS